VAPAIGGGHADLRRSSTAPASSAYTAHLMDPEQNHGYFVAHSPRHQLAFGYIWNRRDFPWLGIWEENASRTSSPWNGAGLTRGMEFGVFAFSGDTTTDDRPRPALRRANVPVDPARARVSVEYWAVIRPAVQIPENFEWPN
jgi:hypothetical protein